jgi:hypothetical protein
MITEQFFPGSRDRHTGKLIFPFAENNGKFPVLCEPDSPVTGNR